MTYADKNKGGWLDWQDPDIRHMEEVAIIIAALFMILMTFGALYLL